MNFLKKMNHRRPLMQGAMLLILIILTIAGCQPQTTEQPEQSAEMPEVSYKYSDEEVTDFQNRVAQNETARYEGLVISSQPVLQQPEQLPSALFYDSGIEIAYPEDGVKGVYLTAENVADPEYLDYIINYINSTDLNAVVIDFKDDWGQIIPANESDNEMVQENTIASVDYRAVLERLEENNIYPIARITSFKDNLLSDMRPDLSFVDPATGEVWEDAVGSQFTNPFLPETWDYVVDVATEAAKMGFKDIQFDYVRFPEGFFSIADTLEYDLGEYASLVSDDPENSGYERVAAINDFLAYASEELAPYGVEVSADIFGYTTIAGDTYDVRGIGQNIGQMAEEVDVISAMIYPSHWGPGFFGLDYPDLYPYEVVDNYMFAEKQLLTTVSNPVKSRPWLQDFTDTSLAPGTYQEYGPPQIQAQIDALAAHGIHEFLLWNAGGYYTEGVDYTPDVEQTEFVEGEEGAPAEEETTDQPVAQQ